jgi:hypothetical protein
MRSLMLYAPLSDFYLFYLMFLIFLFRVFLRVFPLGLCTRAFLIVAARTCFLSGTTRRGSWTHGRSLFPFWHDASLITFLFRMTRRRSFSFERPMASPLCMFFPMFFYLISLSMIPTPYLLCAVVRGWLASSPSDVSHFLLRFFTPSKFSLRFSIACGYDVSL